MAELSEDDRQRRLRAKIANERLKLLCQAMNNMALALLVAAIIAPLIGQQSTATVGRLWWQYVWSLVAFALYIGSYALMSTFRSED